MYQKYNNGIVQLNVLTAACWECFDCCLLCGLINQMLALVHEIAWHEGVGALYRMANTGLNFIE